MNQPSNLKPLKSQDRNLNPKAAAVVAFEEQDFEEQAAEEALCPFVGLGYEGYIGVILG